MKFTTVLAFIAAATAVSATTNAERLARGLPLKAPVRRGSSTGPHKSSPSGTPPSTCNTGSLQCCDSVQKSGEGNPIDELLGLLNIVVPVGTSVGANCSPVTVIGISGNSCTSQTACCDNDQFNGLVNLDCDPININL
ncbi:hydrophobin [Tylopilus felleus]